MYFKYQNLRQRPEAEKDTGRPRGGWPAPTKKGHLALSGTPVTYGCSEQKGSKASIPWPFWNLGILVNEEIHMKYRLFKINCYLDLALGKKKIPWPAWQLECEELGDDMSAEKSSSPGAALRLWDW